MKRLSQLALTGATVIVAIGTGAAAHRTRKQLRTAVREAIARVAGVAPDAVSLADAKISWDGLVLTDVAAGQLAAQRVRIVPSPWSIVTGKLEGTVSIERLVVEDPPLGPFGRVIVEHTDVTIGPRIRVHAREVVLDTEGALAPLGDAHVREVGVELDRGKKSVTRAAFTGLSIGPLRDLAGGLHRRDGATALVAAGPGVKLEAHIENGTVAGSIALERYAIRIEDGAPWLAHVGVPRGSLELTGRASLEVASDRTGRAELLVDTAGIVDIPRLAASSLPVSGTSLRVVATLEDAFEADVAITRGDATLESHVSAGADALLVDAKLPELECASLLRAMPEPLKPALDGLELEGEIGGHLVFELPFDDPKALTLDGDLVNHCRVTGEPPLADVGKLVSEAATLDVRDREGHGRQLVLGRQSPTWLPIARIPQRVIDVFTQAEDGSFTHHPGVDLSSIRSALAHDLATGTPGRGGSTITQQVAKNLFLSGERTVGRKLEEAVLAWRLEQRLGKRRILELYLNLAELGPGIYGVNEGAQAYFNKPVDKLTTHEIIELAALLPAPRRGMDEAWHRRYEQLEARLPAARLKDQPEP